MVFWNLITWEWSRCIWVLCLWSNTSFLWMIVSSFLLCRYFRVWMGLPKNLTTSSDWHRLVLVNQVLTKDIVITLQHLVCIFSRVLLVSNRCFKHFWDPSLRTKLSCCFIVKFWIMSTTPGMLWYPRSDIYLCVLGLLEISKHFFLFSDCVANLIFDFLQLPLNFLSLLLFWIKTIRFLYFSLFETYFLHLMLKLSLNLALLFC